MSDAPPPALGELARRVTMQEIEIRRDEAASHAESHEGSSDYAYHCQERDFWFNVSALVALATGGAADTARIDAIERGDVTIECMGTTVPYQWVYDRAGEVQVLACKNDVNPKTLREAIDAARSLTPERPADAR